MASMDTLTQGIAKGGIHGRYLDGRVWHPWIYTLTQGIAKGGIHGQYMDGRGVIYMRWSLHV